MHRLATMHQKGAAFCKIGFLVQDPRKIYTYIYPCGNLKHAYCNFFPFKGQGLELTPNGLENMPQTPTADSSCSPSSPSVCPSFLFLCVSGLNTCQNSPINLSSMTTAGLSSVLSSFLFSLQVGGPLSLHGRHRYMQSWIDRGYAQPGLQFESYSFLQSCIACKTF